MSQETTGIAIGDMRIYECTMHDRKKPSLIIEKGTTATIYGTFTNEAAALEFFKTISEALGIAEPEEP